MKRFLLLGLAAAWLLPAQQLQQGERDRAMSHLHASRKFFLDSIAGVSAAQWSFKPSPEVWSIAEVAEHIALSEEMLFGLVKKIASGPAADAAKLAAAKGRDEAVVNAVVDRSTKAQAPEPLKPSHRWKTKEELIAHFKKSRGATIEYAKTTTDELRTRVADHPLLKTLDGYQWLMLLSAHSERHVLQLNEVKTKTGYPAK